MIYRYIPLYRYIYIYISISDIYTHRAKREENFFRLLATTRLGRALICHYIPLPPSGTIFPIFSTTIYYSPPSGTSFQLYTTGYYSPGRKVILSVPFANGNGNGTGSANGSQQRGPHYHIRIRKAW